MNKSHSGFSMVEAMVGVTVFVIAALGMASVHQKLGRDATKSRLGEKTLEYMACEIDRLNRLTRLPERDNNGDLVYRATDGSVVNSGGSLVPYGYSNLIVNGANFLNSSDAKVVYPDILDSQTNVAGNQNRVTLKRRYTVTLMHAGQADEYKEVTITLSDAATPPRIPSLTQTIVLKKPDPRALDTRVANGTASLNGRVIDKVTGAITTHPVSVTLIPGDATVQRNTSVDEAGNFYFAPPINPKIAYTVQIQSPGYYWLKTFPLTLTPGANSISVPGNSPGTVALSPIVYADVSITVRSGDTGALIPGAVVSIYHSGITPNSCPSSYQSIADINGLTQFHIQLPNPDVNTYGMYYVALISSTGYISVQNPPDQYLALNKNSPINRSYSLYTEKKGKVLVSVKDSLGLPNPTARVGAYLNPNYTGLADQGNVDSSGQVLLSNLPVNSIQAPTQTSRTYYLRVVSPNHLIYSLASAPAVTITQEEQATANIQMLEHKINWADNVSNVGVNVGYSTLLQARSWYEGHQGPNVSDTATGPNPTSFLGQSVTSGGFPGVYEWTGWDPSVINVTSTGNPYSRNIVGVGAGTTQITVRVTYSFSWNNVPYVLTKSRTYAVACVLSGAILGVSMTPGITTMAPDSVQTFTANPSISPTDLTYTWSYTGDGLAEMTTVNASNNPVPNGSTSAKYCIVKAASTLMTQFNIKVVAASAVVNQTTSIDRNILINYAPLAVALSPSGTVNTQPGYNTNITATASGGSGHYTYTWSLTNPSTGDTDTTVGALANSANRTTFSALQVGTVNVMMHVVDTSSNRTVDNAVLLSVQPAGGVTGGSEVDQ